MSNPNVSTSYSQLDIRYAKPADVSAAISAQATTDAGQYVTQTQASAAAMTRKVAELAVALQQRYNPAPAVASSVPTVTATVGSQGTLTRIIPQLSLINTSRVNGNGSILRNCYPVYNSTYGRIDITDGNCVLDFWLTDSDVEILWSSSGSSNDRTWIFVDGSPISSQPTTSLNGITTTSNDNLVTKISFSSRARRRVTYWGGGVGRIYGIRTNSSGWIAPVGHRPKIYVIGDSYIGGSNGSTPPWGPAEVLARALDVEICNNGYGGSGYVSGGPLGKPYGHTARVSTAQGYQPDLVLFIGSINDQSQTGQQAAATACYNAYAAALPGVPFIVIGPQPTDASNTIAANQYSNAAAVRAAALAHSSVVSYFDPIGFASASSAPAATTDYGSVTANTLYSYKGAIYKSLGTGSGRAPGISPQDSNWELLTWGYTGTGRVGTTAGDGTRDAILYSDNTHPTLEGAELLGLSIADAVVSGLRRSAGLSA